MLTSFEIASSLFDALTPPLREILHCCRKFCCRNVVDHISHCILEVIETWELPAAQSFFDSREEPVIARCQIRRIRGLLQSGDVGRSQICTGMQSVVGGGIVMVQNCPMDSPLRSCPQARTTLTYLLPQSPEDARVNIPVHSPVHKLEMHAGHIIKKCHQHDLFEAVRSDRLLGSGVSSCAPRLCLLLGGGVVHITPALVTGDDTAQEQGLLFQAAEILLTHLQTPLFLCIHEQLRHESGCQLLHLKIFMENFVHCANAHLGCSRQLTDAALVVLADELLDPLDGARCPGNARTTAAGSIKATGIGVCGESPAPIPPSSQTESQGSMHAPQISPNPDGCHILSIEVLDDDPLVSLVLLAAFEHCQHSHKHSAQPHH